MITFWNPPAVETYAVGDRPRSSAWPRASTGTSPEDAKLVDRRAAERDQEKQTALYREYQKVLVDQATYSS